MLLTTGEMARRSSNTLRTVRFYEEEGILRPVRRTDGGHRLFDRKALDRLTLVTDMRAAGLSLDEIKELLDIKQRASKGGDTAKQAIEVLSARINELREKLLVLKRLEEDLTQTTEAIADCRGCDETHAPDLCDGCPTPAKREAPPRAFRVLWSVRPAHAGPASGTIPLVPPGVGSNGLP